MATLEELQEQLEELKTAYSDLTAEKLTLIQTQLARLEATYGSFARTYYNMFYNTTPMDISISIYDDNGDLQDITVPNRASSYQQLLTGTGSPVGEQTGPIGSMYIDLSDGGTLWYKTSQEGASTGWYEVYTTSNWREGQEYLAPDGNGNMLTGLNASNISDGVLSIEHGGTGLSNFTTSGGYSADGSLLAVVPEITSGGITTKAYLRPAVAGQDYLAAQNLSGMIVYFPCEEVPAGYLVCDGGTYKKANYAELYNVLSTYKFPDVEISVSERSQFPEGDWDDYFKVPNLSGVFVRCASVTDDDGQPDQADREMCSYEAGGVPDIQGTWAQEITGAEASFTGAIQIAKKDGQPIQVDGKTSAPAGAYDYKITFKASDYNSDIFRDISEVRVNNKVLLPTIKI